MTDAASTLRATSWLRAGLFDQDFYSALRGCAFDSTEAACLDWVVTGMPARLSPHPFLDYLSLDERRRRLWRSGRVRKLAATLRVPSGAIEPVGPLAGSATRASRQHMVAFAQLLGGSRATHPPVTSETWDAATRRPRRPGGVTVVVVAGGSPWAALRTVRTLLDQRGSHDLDVVLVNGSTEAHVSLHFAALTYGQQDVTLISVPDHLTPSEAKNLGLAHSSGDRVIFLACNSMARDGWLTPLLRALETDTVAASQALMLDAQDMILSAGIGTDSQGSLGHLLVGHPREDAQSLWDVDIPAVSGDALALRALDAVEVGGFEGSGTINADVEMSLRLRRLRRGGCRIVPDSVVSNFGALEQFDPRMELPSELRGHTTHSPRKGMSIDDSAKQRYRPLRWSISIPSTPGAWGDAWGDTHFASGIASALRMHGQDVVTRRRGAHDAGPTHLDDVQLAIWGNFPVTPRPDVVNVLWIISHPDSVRPEHLEGFDVVFAASESWCARRNSDWGAQIKPLLQCTDPALFHPHRYDAGVTSALLFVGNARGATRPMVAHAIDAGFSPVIFGDGWDSLVSSEFVHGSYLPNHELGRYYASTLVTLNDHWDDMRQNGFVSNRVFDAVASGAFVISDPVGGMDDLFGDTVAQARDSVSLRDSLLSFYERGDEQRVEQALRMGRKHSFRARVEVLLRELSEL